MSQLDTPEPASSLSVDGDLSPEPSLAGVVIVKKGWLQGRCPTLGKANASLKRRFFVLEPTRVIWYDHDHESRSSSNLPSAPVCEMSLNPETHIFTDSLAKGQLCVQGFCRALVGEGGEALSPSALVHQAKGKLVLKSASPQEARDWASMIAAQARNPDPNPNPNPNPNLNPNPNAGGLADRLQRGAHAPRVDPAAVQQRVTAASRRSEPLDAAAVHRMGAVLRSAVQRELLYGRRVAAGCEPGSRSATSRGGGLSVAR